MIDPPDARRAAAVDDGELAEALRAGPFSRALRLAVRASGLHLDEIHERLRAQGAGVSKTALSNWQNGRNQPERPASLRALERLEAILGVQAGLLAGLVGPRRPRGRWLPDPRTTLRPHEAWPRPDGLARALAALESAAAAGRHTITTGIHLNIAVDERRRLTVIGFLLLVRAGQYPADHHVQLILNDVDTAATVDVSGTGGCRVGRSNADRETGLHAVELLLDRPLAPGETTALRFDVVYGTTEVDDHHGHRLGESVRDYSIQVRFHPAALPARVVQSYQASISDDAECIGELPVGANHTVTFARSDPKAGIYQTAWEWG